MAAKVKTAETMPREARRVLELAQDLAAVDRKARARVKNHAKWLEDAVSELERMQSELGEAWSELQDLILEQVPEESDVHLLGIEADAYIDLEDETPLVDLADVKGVLKQITRELAKAAKNRAAAAKVRRVLRRVQERDGGL